MLNFSPREKETTGKVRNVTEVGDHRVVAVETNPIVAEGRREYNLFVCRMLNESEEIYEGGWKRDGHR